MSVYIVTGKLGNGKTLVTVGRIKDALFKHVKIATNLDLNLVNMFGVNAKNIQLMRIPDKPSIDDLNAIGRGYDGDDYDEEKFGILVLDECGTWFNSRNWQDKTRRDVNDWFLHARKLGWHVYIIIQDISMLDSQARDAIGELLVVCRRLDKLRIPLLSPAIKMITGFNLTAPRIHRAKVTYADGLPSDVWVYRGNSLFNCYDTRQLFLANYPHGTHSILPPWHTDGRHIKYSKKEKFMKLTKIYWRKFQSPVALMFGLWIGGFAMFLVNANDLKPSFQYFDNSSQYHVASSFNSSSSVSNSSIKSVSTSSIPSVEDRIASVIQQLKVVSYSRINDTISYEFSQIGSDRHLTSQDVMSMGYRLLPINDCSVRVFHNAQQFIIGCI